MKIEETSIQNEAAANAKVLRQKKVGLCPGNNKDNQCCLLRWELSQRREGRVDPTAALAFLLSEANSNWKVMSRSYII